MKEKDLFAILENAFKRNKTKIEITKIEIEKEYPNFDSMTEEEQAIALLDFHAKKMEEQGYTVIKTEDGYLCYSPTKDK